ncbi:p115 like vesicle tethering protein [Dipodascopsis tothii]|uniref:p115 like vesicle tethering protein n=1 Tax=Dipodascopsis tothii TaxID=44089 RepID=UPI0034CF34D6
MQDLLSGILAPAAPKAGTTAAETIAKLCDRLMHSTLLEDRRAAVLGLKGFCREYREAVVAGGLRGLIGELQRDRQDLETVKATLETLLLLFIRSRGTPASTPRGTPAPGGDVDDIALWLADEFTQREENIHLLIDILEHSDFYVRLYSLQLLAAVLANRPARTQQCVFAAPLGISRFVSMLDDHREAVQNEAVLLLIHLVDGHPDIQKLVAFESAFDKAFAIVEREGGVDGSMIVQDSLLLIANLLRFNVSNQNFFRETSCVPRLARLLEVDNDDPRWDDQRAKNMSLVLEICRLFVLEGSLGTPPNQAVFFQTGVLMNVLRLAFGNTTRTAVRATALVTAGDLVRGNAEIQNAFSNIDVPAISISGPADPAAEPVPVTQALLNWALHTSSVSTFDLRAGATMCLEGYLAGNDDTKMFLLQDAVDAYFRDDGEPSPAGHQSPPPPPRHARLLSCVFDYETDIRVDPYRTWFACVILMYVFEGGPRFRDFVRGITLGDEAQGEEVVTAIQLVSGNLVASLQYNLDARIPIAYTMLLCVWLYEDHAAIDDFLSEGSTVQSLVADVSQSSSHNVLVEGMCTCLLAVVYGYTSQQSAIPRPTLHRLLVNRIGRDSIVLKLRHLRKHKLLRDFNPTALLAAEKDETGLPEVFFDKVFVEFFKDCYGTCPPSALTQTAWRAPSTPTPTATR